jgi:hypothetical protein
MNEQLRKMAEEAGITWHVAEEFSPGKALEYCQAYPFQIEAFARSIQEACAKECEENIEESHSRRGYRLAPSHHRESESHHSGITYAQAIRALFSGD